MAHQSVELLASKALRCGATTPILPSNAMRISAPMRACLRFANGCRSSRIFADDRTALLPERSRLPPTSPAPAGAAAPRPTAASAGAAPASQPRIYHAPCVPSRCAVALPAYAGRNLGHHGGSTGRCALLAPCTASRRVCGHHTADSVRQGCRTCAVLECRADTGRGSCPPSPGDQRVSPRSAEVGPAAVLDEGTDQGAAPINARSEQWPNRACSVVLWHSVAASCRPTRFTSGRLSRAVSSPTQLPVRTGGCWRSLACGELSLARRDGDAQLHHHDHDAQC